MLLELLDPADHPVIFDVGSGDRRAKHMTAHCRMQDCDFRLPPHHLEGVGLRHRRARKMPNSLPQS